MAEKSEYQLRISKAIEELSITGRQFCLQCGLSDNFLSSPQKDITTRQIVPILKLFPQINPYYILLGMIGRYILQSFSELQVEVRQLVQENTILKAKLERNESGETSKKKRLPKRKRIELSENKQDRSDDKPSNN